MVFEGVGEVRAEVVVEELLFIGIFVLFFFLLSAQLHNFFCCFFDLFVARGEGVGFLAALPGEIFTEVGVGLFGPLYQQLAMLFAVVFD